MTATTDLTGVKMCLSYTSIIPVKSELILILQNIGSIFLFVNKGINYHLLLDEGIIFGILRKKELFTTKIFVRKYYLNIILTGSDYSLSH